MSTGARDDGDGDVIYVAVAKGQEVSMYAVKDEIVKQIQNVPLPEALSRYAL